MAFPASRTLVVPYMTPDWSRMAALDFFASFLDLGSNSLLRGLAIPLRSHAVDKLCLIFPRGAYCTRAFPNTRPNFEGDKDSPGGGRRRSPVTNTFQTYYPEHKRKVRVKVDMMIKTPSARKNYCGLRIKEFRKSRTRKGYVGHKQQDTMCFRLSPLPQLSGGSYLNNRGNSDVGVEAL